MVVGGASKVKNNMHGNKEDSIVPGCALHRCRKTIETPADVNKWCNFLLLVHRLFANQLHAYWHGVSNLKADQQGRGEGEAIMLEHGMKPSCLVLS